jgi:predicted small lipoprotein YifL
MLARICSFSLSFAVIASIAIALTGCGSKGPTLLPVTGSVTVDGKPANGATLIFHPTDKEMKLIPAATTDENGKFQLATSAKVGVPAGAYDVTVVWPDPSVQPTAAQKMQGLGDPGPDLLNGKYAKKGASGLKTEITSSTKELPPFALTK